eukprot:6806182-Alexandrium_andersonii.AAC.1
MGELGRSAANWTKRMAKPWAERWPSPSVGTCKTTSAILSWRWSAGVGPPWAGPTRDKRATSERPRG